MTLTAHFIAWLEQEARRGRTHEEVQMPVWVYDALREELLLEQAGLHALEQERLHTLAEQVAGRPLVITVAGVRVVPVA